MMPRLFFHASAATVAKDKTIRNIATEFRWALWKLAFFQKSIHCNDRIIRIIWGEKLQYLQSALAREAVNKIKILTIKRTNYRKAWDLLKHAYEVKRVLISRHLSLLINLPILEKKKDWWHIKARRQRATTYRIIEHNRSWHRFRNTC